MQLFIDSANPEEVLKAHETGMIDGVTTNPTLAAKAGINYKEAVEKILDVVEGPVSLEVLSTEAGGMVEEAKKLSQFAPNVVVKIPMGVEGIKATKQLKHENIRINMTLIFSLSQAMLAAKAGADYVSPFIGRLEDIGADGIGLIAEIRDMLDSFGLETEIISASVRSVSHVRDVALIGSDVATIPPGVFWELFNHKLTNSGLDKFLQDFREAGVEPLV